MTPKTLMRVAAVATLAPACLTPASAQDAQAVDDRPYRLVEHYVLDPSQAKMWDASWKAVLKEAERQDYPMPTYGYQHRNHRWMVTPMASYAGVDDMMEVRDRIYEKGGNRFASHIDKMMKASNVTRTYVVKHDADLSYSPDGWQPQPYSRIDTYYYRPDKMEAMQELIGDYRDMMVDLDEPRGFDVYWTAIGAERPGVTFISSAENRLALAEHQSAAEARQQAVADEMEKLFARLQEIVVDTETIEATLKPDMSYLAEGVDWTGSN